MISVRVLPSESINNAIKENNKIIKEKGNVIIYLYLGNKIQLDDNYYLEKFNIVYMINNHIEFIITNNKYSNGRFYRTEYEYIFIHDYKWLSEQFNSSNFKLLESYISIDELCYLFSFRKYYMDKLKLFPSLSYNDIFGSAFKYDGSYSKISMMSLRFVDSFFSDEKINFAIFNGGYKEYIKPILIDPFTILILKDNNLLGIIKDFDFDYYPILKMPGGLIEILNKDYIILNESKIYKHDIDNACIIRKRLMNI